MWSRSFALLAMRLAALGTATTLVQEECNLLQTASMLKQRERTNASFGSEWEDLEFGLTGFRQYCLGNTNIVEESECRRAAKVLGLGFAHGWNGPGDHRDCLFANDNRRKVYFNRAGKGASVSPPNSKYQSVCSRSTSMFTLTAVHRYCPSSMNIVEESDCRQAATDLGLSFAHGWNGPGDHRYCLFAKDNRRKVYFNRAGAQGSKSPPNSKYQSLCWGSTASLTGHRQYCSDNTNIVEESECRRAAEDLGLSFAHGFNGPGDHHYCLFANDKRRKVYFNRAGNQGSISPPKSKYMSVCRR